MQEATAVDRVVAQVRRRLIAMMAMEEFCRASSIACLLLAAMLIAGAGVFHPAWPASALAAAAGWTVWRVRRRAPDGYTAAQRADTGLKLQDLLATAWHLRHNGRDNRSPLAPLVEQSAARACGAAGASRAIPLRWTRTSAIALAAVALLLALFAIRVGLLRSFDLRPPLVAVHFDTLTGAPVPPQPPQRPPAKKLDLAGFTLEEARAGSPDEEQFPLEALRTADSSDSSLPSPQGSRAPNGRMQTPGQTTEPGQELSAEEESGEAADAGQDSGQPQNGKEPPQRAQPQDSLLDKMRDALASLMDKFKLEMPPGDATRTGKQDARQEGSRREKGRPQPGKKGEPGQEGEMLSGQQQAQSDAAQAKSEQAGSPEAASQNEKSGIGKEEGRKDLQAAEDLEAMGKLDELLGKRSQNVQGEVMVEVTNSKNQQLRTPFTGRTGVRTDAGSELGRDEVPLHLQQYVQRYYEQVRRPAAPGKR